MAQKLPRNQDLHERRHHRKAGPHDDRRGTRRAARDELRQALQDCILNIGCPRAHTRVRKALTGVEEER